MKKAILLFVFISNFATLFCQNVNLNNIEIPYITDDRSDRVITHKAYTVSYNYDWKIPNWVAYELTDVEVEGDVPRYDKFKPDPMVPKNVTAYTEDYKYSGYDRGHMAPAADMKWDEQVMRESFYLSNICPQNPNLNGGVWKDLEEQVRDLATQKGRIFVVCGPIVNDASTTIGENKVVVPQAFFKVLLQEEDEELHAIGFIYENKSGRQPMSTYARTIDEVEEITNIDFFHSLPDYIERQIESDIDFTKWTVSNNRERKTDNEEPKTEIRELSEEDAETIEIIKETSKNVIKEISKEIKDMYHEAMEYINNN